jgi:hypothetical protein
MSVLEMYRFKTRNFVVRAYIESDIHVDASFDETGETRAKLDSGEYEAFETTVEVLTATGIKLAESSLWGSIYARPADFFQEHRNPNPMERNCSLMRAARGDNVAICSYFPEMVREAIGEARKAIANMPKVKGV